VTRTLFRLLAFTLLAWALGFAAFAILLPRPIGDRVTDAIVVPTGGEGRIARGIDLLQRGKARRMLITGVGLRTGGAAIAEANNLDPRVFACCVDLGREASNTRANADEILAWLRTRRIRSVRLVTSDWHMPRARFELDQVTPPGLVVIDDAIDSRPDFSVLMREYNKYLLRRVAVLVGL